MWLILWMIMVLAIVALWVIPDYLAQKVYPHIIVEAEAVDLVVDIGDPVTFRCRLMNPARLPCPRVRLSWRLPEQLRTGSESDQEYVDINFALMPRQTAEVTITVYAARRGVAQWNEAYLEFTDSLGLRKDYRTVYVRAQAVIRPKRNKPIELSQTLTDLIGEIRTRRFYNEDPSLFTGVRPYQAGDSLRGISWFATARNGELMVKQFGHTTSSRILVLFNGQMLDAYWKTAYPSRIDAMCERLLQIADTLLTRGASVGLLTNLNDNILMNYYEPPSAGAYSLERLANRMGSISPYPMSSMADLIHSASKYATQGDTLLLFTSYWNDEGIRAVMELNRKYKNVIVYSMNWEEDAVTLHGIPVIAEQLSESGDRGEEAS